MSTASRGLVLLAVLAAMTPVKAQTPDDIVERVLRRGLLNAEILRNRSGAEITNDTKAPPRDGATQDWSKVLKGATPEAVAKALLQPRKPLKPPK